MFREKLKQKKRITAQQSTNQRFTHVTIEIRRSGQHSRTDQIYPCKACSSIHVQEKTIHCTN
uniref:Uncharacterized protein n=1 Tax=Glossina palpalis gambiensis TaxID=67801 RepID=A0A1B0BDD4_9MUSC